MTGGRDDDFQQYVRDRRAALVRLATALASGDAHLAEDLVQTALTRLYVAGFRVRVNSRDAYVRRIIVNALIDEKRLSVTRRESSRAQLPDGPADTPAAATLTDPDLLEALAGLPSGMRAAVVLRHVEGLNVIDTARVLRCSEGNVKSQTARGLDRLRELLSRSLPTTCR